MFLLEDSWWFLNSLNIVGLFPYKMDVNKDTNEQRLVGSNQYLSFGRYFISWILMFTFLACIMSIFFSESFKNLQDLVDASYKLLGSKTDVLSWLLCMIVSIFGNVVVTIYVYRGKKKMLRLQEMFKQNDLKFESYKMVQEKLFFGTFVTFGLLATFFISTGNVLFKMDLIGRNFDLPCMYK